MIAETGSKCHFSDRLLANTLLLFFLLHRMTKSPWKSTFVAALFAVHPLHVESVAWVAERKDVLSTFFWMLTIVAYVFYVERPRLKSYLAVLALFVLGLMAKPMLVTLPFVMLLLDYWPLQRLEQKRAGPETKTEPDKPVSTNRKEGKSKKKQRLGGKVNEARTAELESRPPGHKYGWAKIRPLLVEKIPLLALIPFFCALTYVAEGKAVKHYPWTISLSNAIVSYVIYIAKTVWPNDLAVYYPHPGLWPLWQALAAAFLLGAVTVAVILTAKKFPYLAVGWLWFAGTLVPVIGIVQIGTHGMADRYTYVPLIGLFILIAWGIPELLQKWRYREKALFALSALILLCFLIVTWTQVGYWHNSMALYNHTLKVTNRNAVIHYNRGVTYGELGNLRLAILDYDKAIEINPNYADAYYNRGAAYGELGNLRQAILDYDRAIEINPKDVDAYFNRGAAYAKLGNQKQATEDLQKAARLGSEEAKNLLKNQMVNW